MPPLRIGIIGCGLIGRKRADAAQRLGHAVAAVSDPDDARAAALAQAMGAQACADPAALAALPLDLVVVATPHDALAPLAARMIAAGRHVLIEKPGARHARELAPLADAARARGVLVRVGFNHRFHPAVRKARALVAGGAAGDLLYVRGRYGHGGRLGYEKEWRFRPEISGGGEAIDQGTHLVDLARWFLGDFAEIEGHAASFFWPGSVEDNAFFLLRTAAGQVAQLHASWTEWKNLFSFEIFGRTAKLAIDGLGGSYGTERLTFYKMKPEMGPPDIESWEFPGPDLSWDEELAAFAEDIRLGRAPDPGLADAAAALAIAQSVRAKSDYDHSL
ncbi:MAG: Gfo/Idh/MocA family oxidoreductase [Candidatus Odyssella sp.]|nr:Gfo/Idh/MocA family oxidoreductase [Candidatus Odyssella sp.]